MDNPLKEFYLRNKEVCHLVWGNMTQCLLILKLLSKCKNKAIQNLKTNLKKNSSQDLVIAKDLCMMEKNQKKY